MYSLSLPFIPHSLSCAMIISLIPLILELPLKYHSAENPIGGLPDVKNFILKFFTNSIGAAYRILGVLVFLGKAFMLDHPGAGKLDTSSER